MEHQRYVSRSPGSLDAWGFAMKAMPHVWTWNSEHELAIAEQLLRRAIDADTDYPRANCLLAWTLASRVLLGLAEPPEVLPSAHEMAQRASRHDPEDPWTHFAAGYVHMTARRLEEAVTELTEAITLNPSMGIAHVILGCAYGYGGMPDDGLHHLALAERLNPRDSMQQPTTFTVTGMCHFVARRFAEAAGFERRAVQLRPNFGAAWRTLAAAAGMAGDCDAAAHALAQARRFHPALSVEWVEKYYPMIREEDRAAYIEGLRIAGLG
jgi:tetratricopeptide (TPR) repeat protein